MGPGPRGRLAFCTRGGGLTAMLALASLAPAD